MIGNLKNWSWDVHPQFRIEKEDAEALQDLEVIKEYVKEKESYGGIESIRDRQDKESAEE